MYNDLKQLRRSLEYLNLHLFWGLGAVYIPIVRYLMKYYYLHLWSSGDLDSETVFDRSVHPPLLQNAGLEIDDWPADDLFSSFPAFIASERLKSLIIYWGYEKVKFIPIERIRPGLNFSDNFPEAKFNRYWLLDFMGIPLEDDFALWNNKYLVVSQKALDFLRANRVSNAEADLLVLDIDKYFKSEKRKFFATFC